ncbi:MAG: sulfotransferase, partial [bacterium]
MVSLSRQIGFLLLKTGKELVRCGTKLAHPVSSEGLPTRSADLTRTAVDGDTIDTVTPVFVLSTGRCGTLYLTDILDLCPDIDCNHARYPHLGRHARLAYETNCCPPEVYREVIRATRDEWILSAHARGRIYVETNNRSTFLAPAVLDAYPRSRFIHLVRHPAKVVRSGASRGWYLTGEEERISQNELSRIVMADCEQWSRMSQTEKLAWLWNETNRFIEGFLSALPTSTWLRIRSEDLFEQESTVEEVLGFIGTRSVDWRSVKKLIGRVSNPQRRFTLPPHTEWAEEDRALVRTHTPLA